MRSYSLTMSLSSSPSSSSSSTYLHIFSSHLIFLLLLLHVTHSHAIEQKYNIAKISQGHIGRIRAIATDSPTTRALSKNPDLKNKLMPTYKLFDKISDIIEQRINTSSPEACSLRLDTGWVQSSIKRVQIFQIGKFNDSCLSLVDGNSIIDEKLVPSTFLSDTRSTIEDARAALLQATLESDLKYPDQNWTDKNAPYPLTRFDFERNGQTCSMVFMFGYRVNKRWYLLSSVTNRDTSVVLQDWERHLTHEYIPREFDQSLVMQHKQLGTETLVNATTLVAMWSGRGTPGTVNVDYLDDEDSALSAALRANEVAIDLASDSVTVSNIAILALPMVMTFIPVAFVADLEAVSMFLYVLLTDVFSAIPFLIKGIELVRSSANARSKVHAFHMGNSTLGQMEIWAATCAGEETFRVTGWVFVGVALFAIVGGILLEIGASMMISRRREAARKRGAEIEEGPFGPAVLTATGTSFMGGVRERERADEFWRDDILHHDDDQEEEADIRERATRAWWRFWRAPARHRVEEDLGVRAAERGFGEGYDGHGHENVPGQDHGHIEPDLMRGA